MPPESVTCSVDTPQKVESVLTVLGPAGVGRGLLAEALGVAVPDADPLGCGESWRLWLWLWLWWATRAGGGTGAWDPVRHALTEGPSAVEAAQASLPVLRTQPNESPEDELLRLWHAHPTGPFQRMVLHHVRAPPSSPDGTPSPMAPERDSAWAEWAAEHTEALACARTGPRGPGAVGAVDPPTPAVIVAGSECVGRS